jgi:hypothetical protein
LHDGNPVELQLLCPDLGIEEPLAAAGRIRTGDPFITSGTGRFP